LPLTQNLTYVLKALKFCTKKKTLYFYLKSRKNIWYLVKTLYICIYIRTNLQRKMKVTPLIIEKLLNDKIFRLNTALALGVTERNVQQLAERNSDNLTKMAAVKYYKSTGLKESEIFESENQSA